MEYRLVFKNIADVGVELEGGIWYSGVEKLRKEYEKTRRLIIGTDGSVNVPSPFEFNYTYFKKPEGRDDFWLHNVEIKYWSRSMYDLLEFVKKCFRYGLIQNGTCGNHHHVKFTNHTKTIERIRNIEFYEAFKKEYIAFAKENDSKLGIYMFTSRISNEWCKFPRDYYEYELALSGRNRKFAINFSSLEYHGTLEFRILPGALDFNQFKVMHIWLCATINKLVDLFVSD